MVSAAWVSDMPAAAVNPAAPPTIRPPAGEEAKALVAPRLLDFWRFFRAEAAHAARQALSGKWGRLISS